MSTLRETQTRFRHALLGGETAPALAGIAGDGLSPGARLAIYRHHVAATLTDVLKDVYQVVCRLVDERFFGYAADRFIAAHPPASPCLFEYGEAFAAFLSGFDPCRHLAYLPDVARLEWAMHQAHHAEHTAAVDIRGLAGIDSDDLVRVTVRLHPSLTLLASAWPVDRIWRANQPDADPATVVDLDAGGARLAVWRQGEDVVFRALTPGTSAFLGELHDGRPLDAAAEAALALDRGFDLAAALAALFRDEVLVAFTLAPQQEDSA